MKKIKLTQDKFAIVDDADFERLNQQKWYANKAAGGHWYAIGWDSIKKKRIKMHRLIMNAPKSLEIDHINGNGLDNRKANLRLCTRSENCFNTNCKGVSWHKRWKKWYARIMKNGKSYSLGYFLSERNAIKAYQAARKQLFGKFA